MAAIFEAPTIEQQAAVLQNWTVSAPSLAVVPVQPSGSKSPFFCFGFHAGPVFLPLARRLGSDQPLLSIDPTLLDLSQLPTPYTMEAIAACLVKQIREIQPKGPYYLGGFCAGGLMAYETACQLTDQGQRVDLLALFEPQTPSDYNRQANGSRIGLTAEKLRFHVQRLQQLEIKEAGPYIRDRARTFFGYIEAFLTQTFRDLPSLRDSRVRELDDVLFLAYRDYQPRAFTGRVVLFQASHRVPKGEQDRRRWSELASALEIHEIPGFSNWVLRFFVEPSVQAVAHKLSNCLPTCPQLEVQE